MGPSAESTLLSILLLPRQKAWATRLCSEQRRQCSKLERRQRPVPSRWFSITILLRHACTKQDVSSTSGLFVTSIFCSRTSSLPPQIYAEKNTYRHHHGNMRPTLHSDVLVALHLLFVSVIMVLTTAFVTYTMKPSVAKTCHLENRTLEMPHFTVTALKFETGWHCNL